MIETSSKFIHVYLSCVYVPLFDSIGRKYWVSEGGKDDSTVREVKLYRHSKEHTNGRENEVRCWDSGRPEDGGQNRLKSGHR